MHFEKIRKHLKEKTCGTTCWHYDLKVLIHIPFSSYNFILCSIHICFPLCRFPCWSSKRLNAIWSLSIKIYQETCLQVLMSKSTLILFNIFNPVFVKFRELSWLMIFFIQNRSVFRNCQTSKMELLVKIVNGFQPLPIFAKKLHPRSLKRC